MKEPTNSFITEFRKFIARGNVLDMAIGVIIGSAFKTIVDSLVNDILMPFISVFVGKDSFSSLVFTVGSANIAYGNFIQAILNFLIMALVVFLIIKGIGKLHRKKEATPAPPPAPSKEELLLTEIRDLLKQK